MNPPATRRHPLSFWRSPALGTEAFAAMLELFPSPALLLDAQQGQIVAINSHALALSAYTRAEVMRLLPTQLFPRQSLQPVFNAGKEDATSEYDLVSRSGLAVKVSLEAMPLDLERRWQVLFFEPLSLRRKRQQQGERLTQHINSFFEVAQAMAEGDLANVLEKVMQAGQLLTGAKRFAIYQVDSLEPVLHRVTQLGATENPADQDKLPASLPAAEIGRSWRAQVWHPGKRIRNGLQRLARAYNFGYLAHAGIGLEPALLGLLVAADPDGLPSDDLTSILEVLAGFVTSAFQGQAVQKSLLDERIQHMRRQTINDNILENVQDGLLILAPDYTILEMNPAAELTLGYASLEVTGQLVENVLIGNANLAGALAAASKGFATPSLGNASLHRRDGHAFPAHLQIQPVFQTSTLTHILVFLRDLSEHEQIKVRTQQLEQRALLGEVTAIFAHEVRNPINNISMGLQLLEMNLSDDPAAKEMIERMKVDCDRLTHLMDSVLSFSRAGDYKMEPVDLPPLLERLLMRWKPRMANVKVEASLNIAAPVAQIRANDKALEQVFNNLYSNALRAMRDTGGSLITRVSAARTTGGQPAVQVDISDTGPGIPPDILENIFTPFFTTDPQGTGLGLTITQRIVIAHKGNIQVESFAGGGTVFHLTFPALPAGEITQPLRDVQAAVS